MDLLTIASTEPQSGKTTIAAALGVLARRHGMRAAYRRAGNDADADVSFVRGFMDDAAPLPSESPRIAANADIVFIEDGSVSAVSSAQGSRTLLVAWYQEEMAPRDFKAVAQPFSERLAGILLNGVPDLRLHYVQNELMPSLRAQGLPVLGALPQRRSLAAPTLRDLVDHLGAEVLAFPEKLDVLVESLMIGALALDGGIYYFGQRSKKVVITRWDRPDLQMPALATGCQGLILTGGQAPIPYVWDRLQELQVPVAVVQSGTVATASRLNDGFLARRGRAHAAKIEEMAALIESVTELLPKPAGARAGR